MNGNVVGSGERGLIGPVILRSTSAAFEAVARQRRRAASIMTMICCPLSLGLCVYDYRAMMICFIFAFPALMFWLMSWSWSRVSGPDVLIELGEDMVHVSRRGQIRRMEWKEIGAGVRSAQEFAITVPTADGKRFERVTVPAMALTVAEIDAAVAALAARGVVTLVEPSTSAALTRVGAMLVAPVIGICAAGVLLGAIGNLGMAITLC